jgi:hypothetical protein
MVQPSAAAGAEVKENYTSFRAWLNKMSQPYFLNWKARIKKFSTEKMQYQLFILYRNISQDRRKRKNAT